MPSHVQVFNPLPNQKVKRLKLNVMGKIHGGKIPTLGIYLNNFLIRRVNPSRTGAFECHLDLSALSNGEHHVEVRALFGHVTERVMINFVKEVLEPGSESHTDAKRESDDSGESSS